jgi:REP element-mobilizing transposase RayT
VSKLKHYYGLNHLHYSHHHAYFRVWQRKLYDMNIWTAKKVEEILNYMHNNPVKRGLVRHPGDWPWSRRGGEVLFSE